MNRSKIEWTDYTLNPVKGLCPVACSYCYARAMYKRFKWNPEIRYTDPGFTIAEIQSIKKPSKIFVGSTMELFWDWPKTWLRDIFTIVRQFPQHTFFFLTKLPENLTKWSPFPDNCSVGVSVCNDRMLDVGVSYLEEIQARNKFMSFEPLLEKLTLSLDYGLYYSGIKWLIIGAQSPYSVRTFPEWEWIKEIIDAADKASIPVFLKDNLRLPRLSCEGAIPYYKKHPSGTMVLRQEHVGKPD